MSVQIANTKSEFLLVLLVLRVLVCIMGLTFFTTSNISAEEEKKFTHALNINPSRAYFGSYSLNYEYLMNQTHGFVGLLALASSEDMGISSTIFGFGANYRWHWSNAMQSGFLGVYGIYSVGSGEGVVSTNLSTQKFDLTTTVLVYGINIGKRWVWDSGFNMTFAGGYGLSSVTLEADPSNASIKSSLDNFATILELFMPLYLELSVGYAF